MSLKKHVLLFNRLDSLIYRESTCASLELDEKLGISEHQVYIYLKNLRDLRYISSFCHRKNNFEYEKLEVPQCVM